MDVHGGNDEIGALSVQLVVHLDRQPVTGRLDSAHVAGGPDFAVTVLASA
jgi:hypothetical protein